MTHQFTRPPNVGTRVALATVHHSMHPALRARLGDCGVVVEDDKCGSLLVQFDTTDACYGRWWISVHRLRVVPR